MSVAPGSPGTELGAGRWTGTGRRAARLHRPAAQPDRRPRRARDPRRASRSSRSLPTLFVGPLETLTTATGQPLEPPQRRSYSFGTDELGRDMLNLTVHGARISMAIGLLATLITVVIGVAGRDRGRVRRRPDRQRS